MFISDWRSVASQNKLFWNDDIKAARDVCLYECHLGTDHDADRKDQRKITNVNIINSQIRNIQSYSPGTYKTSLNRPYGNFRPLRNNCTRLY